MRKLASAALAASVLIGALAAAPANAQWGGPPPPPPPPYDRWGPPPPPPPPPPYGYDDWRARRAWQWEHEREWRHREWCRWHACW